MTMRSATRASTEPAVPDGMREIDLLARDALAERVRTYERELAAVAVRHRITIRRLADAAANRKTRLAATIDAGRHLFRRPRTTILHGIKLGLKKGKGELRWRDDATVVKLIRKHFPDRVEALVKVVERPLKTALAQLPAADLKRLGIEVRDAGDEVLIKPTDADIDKLLERLLAISKDEEDQDD